jgi:hypothetical protein
MAKTATGNKKGQEAFRVLQQWREDGVPDLITSYEAWNLTGGLVGKCQDYQTPMRTVLVAIKYVAKKGSVKDYLKIKEA